MQDNQTTGSHEAATDPNGGISASPSHAADWLFPGPLSRAIAAAMMFANLAEQLPTVDDRGPGCASDHPTGDAAGSRQEATMPERTIPGRDPLPGF